MDNSQSSDFLSESTDIFCNSPTDPAIRDNMPYDSLISSTKTAFSSIKKEIKASSFPTYFCTLIEDCGACISQTLDLINDILLDSAVHSINLIEYMNNAVCLQQLLSDLVKHVIESVSMSCCTMKRFPIETGRIISTVFNHCKDSESVYGNHLTSVEKQLKDLFKSCHELQLTYLMVLEKHFVFDLTEKEEQDIFIEALDINLRIGEIVQGLDVKTMAEQWKAYTMICEKYSEHLKDKNIYNECTKILCMMATNNLNTALESKEDKVIVRSLKVCSFTLKILMRICNIFKYAINKQQENVLQLLLLIYLNNDAYLETLYQKSPQFISLLNNNISSSANCLLSELILDENFLNGLYTLDVDKIRSEDNILGYIMLLLNVIKICLHPNDNPTAKINKHKIVGCIYRCLSYCHVWFNIDLKYKTSGHHTLGLYENILTHTIALVVTMNTQEFNALEGTMVEALLSTNCYTAIFSSNLWTMLARMTGRGLLLNQLVSLCKMYQKLENNAAFSDSPQQTHLVYTIKRLFLTMSYEDKAKIYQLFKIHDDKNLGLWVVLEINNLPKEVQSNAEEIVLEKFRKVMSKENVEIEEMIKAMNLARTCQFVKSNEMEGFLIKAWAKACPRNNIEILNKRTMWYYKYVEGLASLTSSMDNMFHNNANFMKVLHPISRIIQSGSTEFKLLLIQILCKLAHLKANDMKNHLVESNLAQIFGNLFHDTNIIVKKKLFNELRKYADNLNKPIFRIINEDDSLRETWLYVTMQGPLNINALGLKQHLQATEDYVYSHKCMHIGEDSIQHEIVGIQKSTSGNFDFADIDTLFDTESDSEPVTKKAKLNSDEVVKAKLNSDEVVKAKLNSDEVVKAKLNSDEVEKAKRNSDEVFDEIISRMEADATSLCKIKENIMTSEYQKRIKKICNKLANILE